MNAFRKFRFLSALVVMTMVLTACGLPFFGGPAPVPAPTYDQNLVNQMIATGIAATQQAAEPGSQMDFPTLGSPQTGLGFTPNWSGLNTACKGAEQMLADVGLSSDQLYNNTVVNLPDVSWEKCKITVELKPELYGKVSIRLPLGYQATADTTSGNILFMGGDPNLGDIHLLHGTTLRWGPTYMANHEGQWLNPNDQRELACRENRFGRYRRSANSGLPGLPYFDRWGPYNTKMGNLNVDWTPPSLNTVVPKNYMDACAILGGLANPEDWSSPDGVVWIWRYHAKVAGSGTYCPEGDMCWQTVYIPGSSTGYVELWDGKAGAPRKFYATDLATLLNGAWNVDEFSYHPYSGQ